MTQAHIGEGCDVAPDARVNPTDADGDPPTIGDDATIRSGTVIYPDITVGPGLTTGHGTVIREETTISPDAIVGTHAVVDGHCELGAEVSLQTGAYVASELELDDRVFLGPHAVLTNDPYPLRHESTLSGPTLADDVSVGANATVLPDVTIGRRSFVAAGAVVTEDIPAETLAVGTPAQHRSLPADLRRGNHK